MNKQDFKHLSIICSIVFAWIMVLFFGIYNPYTQACTTLNAQIEEVKQDIAFITSYKQKYQDLAKYEAKLAKNNQILAEKVPSNLSGDFFLENLNSLASASNVNITSLQIEQAKFNNDDNYNKEGIRLTFVGDYFAVLHFIQELNISPRLIMINTGSISLQGDVLLCELSLQIFADNYNRK